MKYCFNTCSFVIMYYVTACLRISVVLIRLKQYKRMKLFIKTNKYFKSRKYILVWFTIENLFLSGKITHIEK